MIFNTTCIAHRIKTHKESIQLIGQDFKSNLIKTDITHTTDIIDLMELQCEFDEVSTIIVNSLE